MSRRCCCQPVCANVINITATATLVTFTIDRLIATLPGKNCFKLLLCPSMLVNINALPVVITDGTTTVPLNDCSGSPARFDQFFRIHDDNGRRRHCCIPKCEICLWCIATESATGAISAIMLETDLCKSSFSPTIPVVTTTG